MFNEIRKIRKFNAFGVLLTSVALVRLFVDLSTLNMHGVIHTIITFYDTAISTPAHRLLNAAGIHLDVGIFEAIIIVGVMTTTIIRSVLHFGVRDFVGRYKLAYGGFAVAGTFNVAINTVKNIPRTLEILSQAGDFQDQSMQILIFVIAAILTITSFAFAFCIMAVISAFAVGNIIGLILCVKDVLLRPKRANAHGPIGGPNAGAAQDAPGVGAYYRALFLYTVSTVLTSFAALVAAAYGA